MRRVLVVEDEDAIREFVIINLKRAGYDVVDVANGEDALKVFEETNGNFDVILLDIMMPGIDGFTVCKKIREKNNSVGIIILSAKTQEMDKVNGLMLGADDYVAKPFSPSELIARVDSIHRRVIMSSNQPTSDTVIRSGPFSLDTKSRILTKNGTAIDITQVEYQIMALFMQNPQIALSRAEIFNHVWGENSSGDVKVVDVNIRRLRIKIEDEPSNPRYLQTIWGYGYKWVD